MPRSDAPDTPLMQQYDSIKKQHPGEVLFFRLGDFYEMFNEDAVEVSRLLNLTLTHRVNNPMCGIPYHASKIYIARLLRMGKKIAICEQIGDVSKKGLTERKVVEVITPGTAVESEYLEGNVNNFLASLFVSNGRAGFAFIDVTTSAFKATSWDVPNFSEEFPKELGRSMPREILLPESLSKNQDVRDALQGFPAMSVSYYPDWNFSASSMYEKLIRQFKTANLNAFGLNENSPEVPPAGFLLDYLEKTAGTNCPHVSSIDVYHDFDFLVIDESSRKNLEIVSNLRDGTVQYSLLEAVNYTKTSMGNRMMRQWLLFPLADCKKIVSRQKHISLFVENRKLLSNMQNLLSPILDIERLAGRVAMERAHAKDLQALRASLESWIAVRNALLQFDFSALPLDDAQKIIDLIFSAIDENPSTSLTEGGIIKSGWSKQLDDLRNVRDNFDKILSEYESEERAKTGINTLKIKYTNASGYFIEVSRGKIDKVPEHFIMRRALTNGERYTTERLQELAQKLTESGTKIIEMERDLYVELRSELKRFVPYLLQVSGEIAYTDVAVSLAYAAVVNKWTSPEIDESNVFEVEMGRHPVVEKHLPSGTFVPNNVSLGNEHTFALITGPNMAGKSTYLRQNALIALLAQIGSYVPAKFAHVGIIDRIFCRVGASDNLARGESTFLVEMSETALILRQATEKSLVIMDEVGRGTSTEDGLSIAWAVSEYLISIVKCKTLFATHYHELTRMAHEKLLLLCMAVSEEGGSVTFLRKVEQGASANSYGIHVAGLAGLPHSVISRANEILSHIQLLAQERPLIDSIADNISMPEQTLQNALPETPGLFSDEEIILNEILSCDTDNMTPISALQSIARWKKSLSGK